MKFGKLRFRDPMIVGGGLVIGAAISLASGLQAQVPGPMLEPGGPARFVNCLQFYPPMMGIPTSAEYPTIALTATEYSATAAGTTGQTAITTVVLECKAGTPA